jgi:hypothetical protein
MRACEAVQIIIFWIASFLAISLYTVGVSKNVPTLVSCDSDVVRPQPRNHEER